MTDGKKTKKIELWEEIDRQEKITVIKTEGTTTKIHRKKFNEAMSKIINDSMIRSKLEMNPVKTMAEFGIEINDEEKVALAGKRLSEAIAHVEIEPLHVISIIEGPQGPLALSRTISRTIVENPLKHVEFEAREESEAETENRK